jgi:hypothetical protein
MLQNGSDNGDSTTPGWEMMKLLSEEDPEHWLHVVPAGRSLLEEAAWQFRFAPSHPEGLCTASAT